MSKYRSAMSKGIITTAFFLLAFNFSHAQIIISGASTVNQGSSEIYYQSSVSSASFYNWDPDAGLLQSSSLQTAVVLWNSAGSQTLYFNTYSNGNYMYGVKYVTVTATSSPPSTPNATVTKTNNCGNTVLTRTTNPPSGVTWYWQSTSSGTSTSSSGTSITRTSGTSYYLRARNTSGQWSSSSQYISYTITQPQIWYADLDGDGLGDPNTTQSQCGQPANYVSNNTDQCPNINSPDNSCISAGLSDENYVFTRTYQVPRSHTTPLTSIGTTDAIESVTYYDGLGRPMQNVAIRASDTRKDILTHIGYDGFGRQEKEWLPMATGDQYHAAYRGDISTATSTFYGDKFQDDINPLNPNPFSQKQFEASPLNRVLKQAAPGHDWRLGGGHEIEMDYDTNTSTEVRLYTVSLTSDYTPTLEGGTAYYGAGELYKTITRDENHTSGTNNTTEEFKDKQGRVVLKRTYNNGAHDTYYVYDDYGNLTYVLPPKAEATGGIPTATELSELCYQYRYDDRNRLIEKKIPGKGKEYIVYNKLDQPAMTQDANLDAQDKWLFTKYDAFGRVVYTGRWSGTYNRTQLQNILNGASVQFESRTTTANSYASQQVYYSNGTTPTSINDVYTVNYYDSYLPSGASGRVVPPSQTSYGTPITTNVKTLPTVSRVRVLTTNDWITTTTGYDEKGRAIWIRTVNDYLDTDDIVEMKLDFTGKVLETKTIHNKIGQSQITTVDKFTYDHMGRLTKQTQKINSQAEELIALNEYDELGQLENKKVGGIYNGNGLQSIDYGYNVRGWLKTINDPGVASPDKLFAFKINYNTQDHGATPLYNGNISETEWRTANTDNSLKWYKYGYDALNRITYATDNNNRYSLNSPTSPIIYDKNGNINSIVRKGHVVANPVSSNSSHFGTMDNLAYVYDAGNKLLKVTDAVNLSNTVKGQFNDGNKTGNDYEYDPNGNMIKDLNKGIVGANNTAGIQYNHLNLPTSVTILNNKGDGTGAITYIYDATGTKLTETAPGKVTQYAGNYIYETEGGTTSLKFFNQPEGYVEKPSTLYEYVYQYKDHLGNIRLSYKNVGSASIPNLQIQEENNYYPFGLRHKGYNNLISEHPYKYNGKELNEELGLNWYDYGARNYDASLGRWMNIDPLASKYDAYSPYSYAFNSPVYFIDPDGRRIIGASGEDSDKVVEDTHSIFEGEKFAAFRGLIKRQNGFLGIGKSKKLAKIGDSELAAALDGVELTEDEQALVDTVVGTINSDDKHKVEFGTVGDNFSSTALSNLGSDISGLGVDLDRAIEVNGGLQITNALMGALGGSVTKETNSGTYSFILEGGSSPSDYFNSQTNSPAASPGGRELATGHEVYGHGRSLSTGRGAANQHTDAIQMENLIIRVMGHGNVQRTGTNHGPGTRVQNASDRPSYQ